MGEQYSTVPKTIIDNVSFDGREVRSLNESMRLAVLYM